MKVNEQSRRDAEAVAFSGFLAYKSRFAFTALANHLERWSGDFFTHLLMGDIAGEFEKMYPIDSEMLEFLKILDAELASGTEGARGLIKTGFIEELTFGRPETLEFLAGFPNLDNCFRKYFGL